ncbi:MAG: hypothetical protein HOP11_02785 [Saprospiraceae bacterium]|nr:hypothetical protein [Saprospiraceae bacterium]
MILRKKTIRNFLGILLCVIVGLHSFYAIIKSNHKHHHSVVQHTDLQESDPCHRAIYHNDKEAGCQHKGHLGDEEDTCKFCNEYVSVEFIFTNLNEHLNLNYFNDKIKLHVASLLLIEIHFTFPRGPPLFIA